MNLLSIIPKIIKKDLSIFGDESSLSSEVELADSFQKAPENKEQAERVEEKNISEEKRES